MSFKNRKIAKIRKDLGVTQKQIAYELCTSERRVRNWEKGHSIPSKSEIFMLAKVLHVDVNSISDFEDNYQIMGTELPHSNIMSRIKGLLTVADKVFLDSIQTKLNLQSEAFAVQARKIYCYNNMTDAVAGCLYKKRANNLFKFSNMHFARLAGKTPEAIVGRNSYQVFPMEFAVALQAVERKIFSGEHVSAYEIQLPGGSLNNRKGLLYGTPVVDAYGAVTDIVVYIEEKTNEMIILDKHKLLEKVINLADIVFWFADIKNKRLKYDYVSWAAEKISGYSQMSNLSSSGFWIKRIVHEDHRAAVNEFRNSCVHESVIDYTILTYDNSRKFIHEKCYNEDGVVFFITKDITKKVKAERIVNVLASSIASIYEGVSLANLQTKRYIFFNKRYEEITGFNADELKTMDLDCFYKCIHPDDVEYLRSSFITGNRPPNHKFRINHPTRGLIHAETNIRYINYQSVNYACAILREITD